MEPPQKGEADSRSECDESKCVSRGLSERYDSSFTCYGDEDDLVFPMMCADGFLPKIVEDEPPLMATGVDGIGDVELWYFTCCPPYHQSPEAITNTTARHCSDPITGHQNIDENSCNNNDSRRYPRRMKPHLFVEFKDPNAFICCDFDINKVHTAANVTDFLDDVECVPYTNDYRYTPGNIYEEPFYQYLSLVLCDFRDDEFPFARPLGEGANNSFELSGRYQCCKEGPTLPFYVQDSFFQVTVYTHLAFYCVAAVAAAVVAIGLLIPLLIQLIDGSYKRARATLQQRGSRGEAPYSIYNLYLVYLALPDLSFCILKITKYVCKIEQKICGDSNVETAFAFAYVTSNLWINSIACYQILILLRNSHHAQRNHPPSLTRVNLEVGAAFVLSAITGFVVRYRTFITKIARISEDLETFRIYITIGRIWVYAMLLPPVLYVCYVGLVIWWRGYMPSINGPMKELAFYFFRIVVIFLGIWAPGLALWCFADGGSGFLQTTGRQVQWAAVLTDFVPPLQIIVTSCMALTKSDTRRYILALVTCSYFCKTKGNQSEGGNRDELGIEPVWRRGISNVTRNHRDEAKESTKKRKFWRRRTV